VASVNEKNPCYFYGNRSISQWGLAFACQGISTTDQLPNTLPLSKMVQLKDSFLVTVTGAVRHQWGKACLA